VQADADGAGEGFEGSLLDHRAILLLSLEWEMQLKLRLEPDSPALGTQPRKPCHTTQAGNLPRYFRSRRDELK